ncbi:Tat pathway signal protein [Methylobacterium sp. A54F]
MQDAQVKQARRWIALGAGFAGVALAATAAPAQDAAKAPPLKIQLNRLEPADESCRFYLQVDNTRGPALKVLKVSIFAFDTDGIAQRNLAVPLGPMPKNKTSMKIFAFNGLPCQKIGRVLLDDVQACEGDEPGVTRESCLDRLETETKAGVPFDR